MMKRLCLFVCMALGVANIFAQDPCFPVDSLTERLRNNVNFESACKGDPMALGNFGASCLVFDKPEIAFLCFKRASELGYSYASLELAEGYRLGARYRVSGFIAEQDTALASHYYKLALDQDTTGLAHMVYGNLYIIGDLVKPDVEMAKHYWQKSAYLGSTGSMFGLARCYFEGKYFEQDYVEAKKWLDMLLLQPDGRNVASQKTAARAMLAEIYGKGLGVEPDPGKAFEIYLTDSVWLKMAECYESGHGVKADHSKAVQACMKVLKEHFAQEEECDKAIAILGRLNKGIDAEVYSALAEYYEYRASMSDLTLSAEYRKQTGQYKSFRGMSTYHKTAFDNWEQAAALGNVAAIKRMVYNYLNGTGVEKDSVKATEWVVRGVGKSQDKDLLYMMAWHNAKGIGIPVNEAEAVKWYIKAVKAGHMTAATNLGWCYANGFGCKVDYKKAAKYYAISAEHGEALGLNNLGVAYLQGEGVKKDYEKGISLMQKAIQKGCVRGLPYLFQVFYRGLEGYAPNLERGAEVFRALDDSLNHTNENCLFYLHTCIGAKPEVASDSTELIRRYTQHLKNSWQKKDVVLYNFQDRLINCAYTNSKDVSDAVNWLRTESERGDTKVKYTLYSVINARPELAKDRTERINLLRDLAESGHAESQFQMAWSYAKGLDVEIDSVKAVSWYAKAAANGHQTATFNLAWCYDNGFGCVANPEMAFEWYKKGAELGELKATYELGRRYYFGIGVTTDTHKAIELLAKVSSSDHELRPFAISILANHYWEQEDYVTLLEFSEGLEKKYDDMYHALSFYRAMALLRQGKADKAFRELSVSWNLMRFMKEHSSTQGETVNGNRKYLLILDGIPHVEYLPDNVDKCLPAIYAKHNIKESELKSLTWQGYTSVMHTKAPKESKVCNLVKADSSREQLFEMYNDYANLLKVILPDFAITKVAVEMAAK